MYITFKKCILAIFVFTKYFNKLNRKIHLFVGKWLFKKNKKKNMKVCGSD